MKSLSTSTNRIHPYSLIVQIPRNFGGDLRAELKKIQDATTLSLLVNTYDPALVKKLTALKFKIMRKTYMSTLWNLQTLQIMDAEPLTVLSASQLTADQRRQAVIRMQADYVRLSGAINPAKITRADVINNTFNADDFAHNDSIFYFDDFGELAGYVTLTHITPETLEIGCLCADNPKILTHLVNTLFTRLQLTNYTSVSAEFASTDPQAIRVMRALPVSWPADHQPLITLMK